MTVLVSKPSINLRDELNIIKSVDPGIRGIELVRSSSIQDIYNVINPIGFKNYLINPCGLVSQRGTYTTATAVTNLTYYLDRWRVDTGAVTATIQQVTANMPPYSRATTSIKQIATSSSSSAYMGTVQFVEDKNWASLKNRVVSISAWVRSNNNQATISFWDGISATVSKPHSGNGGWEKLTATGVIAYNATTLRYGVYITVPDQSLSTTIISTGDYVEFTEAQLEVGPSVTPFEYRPFQYELNLCQRYFAKSTMYGTTPTDGVSDPRGAIFTFYSGTAAQSNTIALPVPMMSQPTIALYRPSQIATAGRWAYFDGGSWVTPTGTNTTVINESLFQINITSPVTVTIGYSLIGSGVWTATSEI